MQYRNSSYASGEFDTFWFEKNLQGDIVAVYNEGGTKLVSYTYDAWGNIETYTHDVSGTNFNATYNPFRYRGYYYDSELGFYYLNSRYYDPETGRFISEDGYVSTGQGILGYNMFAYCRNEPVFRKDAYGTEDVCVEIYDEDTDLLDELMAKPSGSGSGGGWEGAGKTGGYGGTWDAFRSSLQDALNGLKMASGRDTSIVQSHHLISNKHNTKINEYQKIISKYEYSLNDKSNLVNLRGHRGRHTNAYHDFIDTAITELDSIAAGDSDIFKEGMVELGNFILEYPWIPYAKYK